jgi:putative transposase
MCVQTRHPDTTNASRADTASPQSQLKAGVPKPSERHLSDGPLAHGTEQGQSETGAPKNPLKTGAPRGKPPRNPGLRKFIKAKREWSEPLDESAVKRGFLGWHARGYLPHFDAPGITQFVTFRLDDAMPASRRSEWEALLRIEDDRERRIQLETYLDRSFGECWLRRPEIARLVCDALKFFDGKRYRLDAWVVMPNHAHVLVEIWQTPMGEILKSWKGFTSREANKILGRTGRFWEREHWDTRIRDEEHLRKSRRYIEMNPVKAGMVRDAADWPWSSAHGRKTEGRPK